MKVSEVKKYLIELGMASVDLEVLAARINRINDPVIAMTKETGGHGWTDEDKEALVVIGDRVDRAIASLEGK